MTPAEFFAWEAGSRDCIDVKRHYIDATAVTEEDAERINLTTGGATVRPDNGDLASGMFLSQLIFHWLPKGPGGLTERDGEWWLIKRREDWWNECRITAKQFDRVSERLVQLGMIKKRLGHGDDGKPAVWLCINWTVTIERVIANLPKWENGGYPFGKMEEADSLLGGSKSPNKKSSSCAQAHTREEDGSGPTPPSSGKVPERLPDGSRRLTDLEVAALERLAGEFTRSLVIGGPVLAKYRRLFSEGLSLALLEETVRAVSAGQRRKRGDGEWKAGGLDYFTNAISEAMAAESAPRSPGKRGKRDDGLTPDERIAATLAAYRKEYGQ